MNSAPTSLDEKQEEVFSETERKLREWDAAFEHDCLQREEAEKTMKEIRHLLPLNLLKRYDEGRA